MKQYFGTLEEESIRDNFVIIYEVSNYFVLLPITFPQLLDEMMDFGYPQATEHAILSEFITQEGNRLEAAPRPPVALTTAVSWRRYVDVCVSCATVYASCRENIKHRKNEVFLDVVEKLNLLVASNGTVLHSEILGAVQMKSQLSGSAHFCVSLVVSIFLSF